MKKQNTPRHKTVHPTVDKPMVLENGGESIAIGFTDRKLSPHAGSVVFWKFLHPSGWIAKLKEALPHRLPESNNAIRVRNSDSIDISKLAISTAGKEPSIIIGPGVPVKKTADGKTLVPDGTQTFQSKEVYGVMIRKLLPAGVMGLLAAALMAALMGNLSSASNSIATMVSYDVVKRFKPDTSDKQLVLIGRIAALAAISSGIALVPLLDRYESIFNGLNEFIAHMAPPITCVFALGVFWPATSARSAKLTMWFGSIMGAAVFAIKTLHTWKPDTFAWTPEFFHKTQFMMMAFYMCVVCVILQVLLTFSMPKLAGEDSQNL